MAHRGVHLFLLVAVLASPLTARAAQATQNGPAIEIGVDGAVARDFYDGGARPWGPRVVFNLSPETALVIFGENRVAKGRAGQSQWSSRLLGAEIRQTAAQAGPFALNVIAGGGASIRTDSRVRIGTRLLPAVILGAGFSERIGRHFSVRQEIRLILAGDGSELRAQLGVSAPIGRYQTDGAIASRRFGNATVRTAQYVWFTRADGSELDGSVRSIGQDEIILSTSQGLVLVAASDVVRIERTDRVTDGMKRGAAIGAASAAGLFAILQAACRGDCMGMTGALLLGAGLGGGVGGGLGAVVDGLNRHRDVVFERVSRTQTLTIVPLVRPGSAGIATRFEWQ